MTVLIPRLQSLTLCRAGLVTQLLALLGTDSAVVGKALFTPVGLGVRVVVLPDPRVVMGSSGVVNFDRRNSRAHVARRDACAAFAQVMLPQLAARSPAACA